MRRNWAMALQVLQGKAVQAAVAARNDADLLAAQRDIVEGARRLEAACQASGDVTTVVGEIAAYRATAEAALARMEAPPSLPRPPQQVRRIGRLGRGRA
jgi:hypothetical protein